MTVTKDEICSHEWSRLVFVYTKDGLATERIGCGNCNAWLFDRKRLKIAV